MFANSCIPPKKRNRSENKENNFSFIQHARSLLENSAKEVEVNTENSDESFLPPYSEPYERFSPRDEDSYVENDEDIQTTSWSYHDENARDVTPPPLPPRPVYKSTSTQTSSLNHPSDFDTDNDVIVSHLIDYHTCKRGVTLSRVLKTNCDITLNPKKGYIASSQFIFYPGTHCEHGHGEYTCMCSTDGGGVYNRVAKLTDHWLKNEVSVITVKQGVVHPNFTGRLSVFLFNTSNQSVKLSKNTPIAALKTQLIEYPLSSFN